MDLYRSNAIRVLCSIIDSQLLAQIERYLKQAVVDRSPVVASAVLVSALHLQGQNMEVRSQGTARRTTQRCSEAHPCQAEHMLQCCDVPACWHHYQTRCQDIRLDSAWSDNACGCASSC